MTDKPKYVFYDTETTGLDLETIQILQIGLIATNENLKDVATEKLEGRISPWELPAPGALLTTGFDLEAMKKRENSNFDMMTKLAGWLKQVNATAEGPVTFIGYNSADYDERVMEQNFYQNLLPADVTTGPSPDGQPNGRADVIAMVRLASLYMPGAIKMDIMNANGSASMTLKNIARENGVDLGDEDAHDALNDIRATVGVAGVVQKVAPQIWEQSLKLSTPAGVDKFLADNEIFTGSEFEYGKPHIASVMTSMTPVGATQEALFDLRLDPAQYMDKSVEELKALFLSQKKGNPFLTVDKSNSPMLMPIDQSGAILTEQDNLDLYKQRAEAIKANPAFLAKIAEAAEQAQHTIKLAHRLSDKMPEALIDKPIAPDVQAKLDTFAKEFHDAPDWHARAVLTRGFYDRFKTELAADPSLSRFEKLAERLVYEHAPQEVSPKWQDYMKKFIAYRTLDPNPNAPYMTIARARTEIAKIRKDLTKPGNKWAEAKGQDIDKLEAYYNQVEKDCAKLVPGYTLTAATTPANDTKQESSTPVRKTGSDNTPKA
jgi:exodeoxyribonuclease-1